MGLTTKIDKKPDDAMTDLWTDIVAMMRGGARCGCQDCQLKAEAANG